MDLILGKVYYSLDQYRQTIAALKWNNLKDDNKFFSEVQLLLGFSYARNFDHQSALNEIALVKPDSDKKNLAEKFRLTLQDIEATSRKSPFLAGTFSAIIPGSGYLYCGRNGTALTSFIINGVLIWAISDAIKHEQYGITSAVGAFGLGSTFPPSSQA